MTAPRPLYVLPECPSDPLDAAGLDVIGFSSAYVNDPNKIRRSLKAQQAAALMDRIRDLWESGAWRHYRHGLGEFEWREHEFDYFLAAQMIAPREVADILRGYLDDWATVLNSANPGRGQRGKTRRDVAEVADQIRRSIPGGHGDADVWVRHAAAGFGDQHDQAIAASPKLLRQAKKAGSVSAVKDGDQVRVFVRTKRDPSKSEDQQRADLILRYLADRPTVAALVKKGL